MRCFYDEITMSCDEMSLWLEMTAIAPLSCNNFSFSYDWLWHLDIIRYLFFLRSRSRLVSYAKQWPQFRNFCLSFQFYSISKAWAEFQSVSICAKMHIRIINYFMRNMWQQIMWSWWIHVVPEKMLKHTRKGKAKIVEISMAKQKTKLERRSGNNDRMYG